MRRPVCAPWCPRQRLVAVLLLAAWAGVAPVASQEMEDVVYLKDGTSVRGIVVARILGESVEIQVRDGNVQVYAMDEISRIAKEPVTGPEEIEPTGDATAPTVEGPPAPEIVEAAASEAEAVSPPEGEETPGPEADPAPPPEAGSTPGLEAEAAPAPGVESEQTRGTRALAGGGRRNPWLAFGLSALVPGAGQFYNGQHTKGVPQLGAALAGSALVFLAVRDNYENAYGYWVDPDDDDRNAAYGGILWLGGVLWSVTDAAISANRLNGEAQPGSGDREVVFDLAPTLGRGGAGVRLDIRFQHQ